MITAIRNYFSRKRLAERVEAITKKEFDKRRKYYTETVVPPALRHSERECVPSAFDLMMRDFQIRAAMIEINDRRR